MKKIAVIGANGFTGRRILNQFVSNSAYQLTAASLREDLFPSKGYTFCPLDITQPKAILEFFHKVRPDVVINCAALSVPDYCELHHDAAYQLNVAAVEELAKNSSEYDCQLIHLSTDFVFDGKKEGLYTEDDAPNPVNYYGRTKYWGEQAALSYSSNAAIARVVVVYGQPLLGQHGNIVKLVKDKLQKGETIRVVSDQYRTPTWVSDIAIGMECMIQSSASGIYHICGDVCLSIAEIAFRTADFFELDRSLIIPVTTEEMQEATPRPRFSGLSHEKARIELNYRPHTLEKGMEEMK